MTIMTLKRYLTLAARESGNKGGSFVLFSCVCVLIFLYSEVQGGFLEKD